MKGQMRLIDKGAKHLGLRRFFVYREELAKQFPLPGGYMSVPDAPRLPFLSLEFLRGAIRGGHLPTASHPKFGRMLQLTAITTFQRKYVNLVELEHIYRINRTRIWAELADSAAVVTSAHVRLSIAKLH